MQIAAEELSHAKTDQGQPRGQRPPLYEFTERWDSMRASQSGFVAPWPALVRLPMNRRSMFHHLSADDADDADVGLHRPKTLRRFETCLTQRASAESASSADNASSTVHCGMAPHQRGSGLGVRNSRFPNESFRLSRSSGVDLGPV